MKWSPSATRYELPFFVIAAAAVGTWGERTNPPFLWKIIIAVLFICAIPYVINCYPRHLLGSKSIFHKPREERYFMMVNQRYKNFALAADRLKDLGCRDIGLVTGEDDWEYPLWPLLQQRGMKNIRIEHIDISGPTSGLKYPLGDFHPCAEVQIQGGVINFVSMYSKS